MYAFFISVFYNCKQFTNNRYNAYRNNPKTLVYICDIQDSTDR